MLVGDSLLELQEERLLVIGFAFGFVLHGAHLVGAVHGLDAAGAAGDELRRQKFRLEERERRRHPVGENKGRQDEVHFRAVRQRLQGVQQNAQTQAVVESGDENGKILLGGPAARRHFVLDVADCVGFASRRRQLAERSDQRQAHRRLPQQPAHQTLAVVIRFLQYDDGVLV